jgi:FKBP-type peptidyl-prolyl cis-trans isomerase 2
MIKLNSKSVISISVLFVIIFAISLNLKERFSTKETPKKEVNNNTVGQVLQGSIDVIDQVKQLQQSGILDKIDSIVKEGNDYRGIDIIFDVKHKSNSKKGSYCHKKTLIKYSYDDKLEQEVFILPGERKMSNGIEIAVMQMEEGDKFDIYLPDFYSHRGSVRNINEYREFGNTKLNKYSIEIKSIENAINLPENYQVIFTKRNNNGVRTICGAAIIVSLNIRDQKGNAIFDSNASGDVIVNIGHGRLPFGIEKAILGMKSNEIATVIMPKDTMKYYNKAEDQDSIDLLENSLPNSALNVKNWKIIEENLSNYNQDIAIVNIELKQVIF